MGTHLGVSFVLAGLLAGCRCHRDPPADLLELVPADAVFVMSVDLATLKRSEAFKALRALTGEQEKRSGGIGFDVAWDVDRIALGAASQDRELEFVAALRGQIKREKVLERMGRQGLATRTHRGRELYQGKGGVGPLMLFAGEGVLVLVSEGWLEPLLDRLAGKGRPVVGSSVNPLARDIAAMRGARRPAWVVSRLAPATGTYLASRLGLGELRELLALQGSLEAKREVSLRLELRMDGEEAARGLRDRLGALVRPGTPLERLRLELSGGRRLQLDLSLAPAEIRRLFERAAGATGG